MLSKFRAQAGFAIVEVLVATVVLAIGFLELARAFRNINGVANQAVAMTKASNLAHATMERIMSQNFDARGNEAGGYALDFDGDNDWVDVGAVHNDIQTISFWIQADAVSGTDYVIDLNGTAYIKVATGVVTAVGITSPTYYLNGVEVSSVLDRTITADAWYHVAVTTATPIDAGDAGDVDIGRVLTGEDEEYFDGKIDEVRLWDNVRTNVEIDSIHNSSIPDPYNSTNLVLYCPMNNGTGLVAFDHSVNKNHGSLEGMDNNDWVTGYSTSQGREGETTWSGNDDVDDFHTVSFKDSDYTGLDRNPASNNFSGLGGQVYVKYVSLNTGTAGTIEDPYTFVDSAEPTDYKQITVKVGIPGTTDSTQIDAIKSAKVGQGYPLTFSPYGL
jgi:Tfp pilus assembly protein PilV